MKLIVFYKINLFSYFAYASFCVVYIFCDFPKYFSHPSHSKIVSQFVKTQQANVINHHIFFVSISLFQIRMLDSSSDSQLPAEPYVYKSEPYQDAEARQHMLQSKSKQIEQGKQRKVVWDHCSLISFYITEMKHSLRYLHV